MTRFRAFLIHLGISFVIFLGLSALVLFVWYPDFFFATEGGWQGIRIIVFVDLVLGPLLTLIAFNPKKPRSELARDLSVIAAIQSVCLIAGTYVVFDSRPLALVYVDGNFYTMTHGAYEELDLPAPELTGFPGPWPKRVTVAFPRDPIEQSEIRRDALENGTPVRALSDLYRPFEFDDLVYEESLSVDELRRSAEHADQIESWMAGRDAPDDDYAFFFYATRYGFTLLGVSKSRRQLLGAIADPIDRGGGAEG